MFISGLNFNISRNTISGGASPKGIAIVTLGQGTVSDNIISNVSGGIVGAPLAYSNIERNQLLDIGGTSILGPSIGMLIGNGAEGSIFANNTIDGADYGFWLAQIPGWDSGATSNSLFLENNISNCGISISIANESVNDTFAHNNIINSGTYAFENNEPYDINAGNNYWGTSSCSAVNSSIQDVVLDDSLGLVVVNPILSAAYPSGSSSSCVRSGPLGLLKVYDKGKTSGTGFGAGWQINDSANATIAEDNGWIRINGSMAGFDPVANNYTPYIHYSDTGVKLKYAYNASIDYDLLSSVPSGPAIYGFYFGDQIVNVTDLSQGALDRDSETCGVLRVGGVEPDIADGYYMIWFKFEQGGGSAILTNLTSADGSGTLKVSYDPSGAGGNGTVRCEVNGHAFEFNRTISKAVRTARTPELMLQPFAVGANGGSVSGDLELYFKNIKFRSAQYAPAIATTFDGSTTNFSSLSDLSAVASTTIEKSGTGKIVWSQPQNCNGLDFDSAVTINSNDITVDTETLGDGGFDSPATLTFNGLAPSIPMPAAFSSEDGGITWNQCLLSTCPVTNLGSGAYRALVQHFSSYKIGPGANLTVWNSADPQGGGNVVQVGDDAVFYADYSNASGPIAPAAGGACNISFNDSANNPMAYNLSTNHYTYDRSFTSTGTRDYSITCAGTIELTAEDAISIIGSPVGTHGYVTVEVEATNQILVYTTSPTHNDTMYFKNRTIPSEGLNFYSNNESDMNESETGFYIENQGNVAVLLNVSANKDANGFIGGTQNGGPLFRYWVEDNETGSCGTPQSTETDMTTGSSEVCGGTGLDFEGVSDSINCYIHIYVPSDASPGEKTAILTFTSTAVTP